MAPKTRPKTELGALLGLQADWLRRDLGATILGRDDEAGTLLAAIPDAATVEYRLTVKGHLPPFTEERPRSGRQ